MSTTLKISLNQETPRESDLWNLQDYRVISRSSFTVTLVRRNKRTIRDKVRNLGMNINTNFL